MVSFDWFRIWNQWHGDDFDQVMKNIRGGITIQEGSFLRRLASGISNGCIVEVGSFQGKSAVALDYGVRDQVNGGHCVVYCIEPHRPFTGFYGGKFGPSDRGAFYRTMCNTGAFNNVALINQSSEQVTPGWNEPVGLLFIDGDHRYEAVRRDFNCWDPHIVLDGIVAFDDACDPACGPYKVIEEVVTSGCYKRLESVGKIVALRKTSVAVGNSSRLPDARQRILVPCHSLVLRGGLLRFERVGKVLRDSGHELAFVAFDEANGHQWTSELPILTLEQASCSTWNAVMIPGAGFPEKISEMFSVFLDRKYGTRVQHILNDQSRRAGFMRVNKIFQPDIVIFNNQHWPAGSFTDFNAGRFHVLLGAVDSKSFHPKAYGKYPRGEGQWVVGGLARKNPEPLIEALSDLPSDVALRFFGCDVHGLATKYPELIANGRLQLTGPLDGDALCSFYRDIDCTAMTETYAGWSNLVAESMASGVPVVCTPHGTGAMAQHEETALVIDSPPNPRELASALQRLRGDAALCRKLAERARAVVSDYSWDVYARELLKLIQPDSHRYYTFAPDLGLHGKWSLKERLGGLEFLLERAYQMSVIDFGAAEGVISREFLKRGAKKVHGFDIDANRVDIANRLCATWDNAEFRTADISDWAAFRLANQDLLEDSYDVVLYLGIHHHLPSKSRRTQLMHAVRLARSFIAIRTSQELYDRDHIDSFLNAEGFRLIKTKCQLTYMDHVGHLRIYERYTG
jgi:glycosyltransferase involved in cell wall biosynthesis